MFAKIRTMKKLLLLLLLFVCNTTVLSAQAGNKIILAQYVSTPSDTEIFTGPPTRISKNKDTLYVINNTMGVLIKQLWINQEFNKGQKAPVIIFVSNFEMIDEKKIAFKPEYTKG
jgi:hypothetical protein